MPRIFLTALTLALATPAAADTAAVVNDHARPGYEAFDYAVARLADVERRVRGRHVRGQSLQREHGGLRGERSGE